MKKIILITALFINIIAIGLCYNTKYECINHYSMLVSIIPEQSLATRQTLDAAYQDTIDDNNWNNVTYVSTGPGGVSSSVRFDCMSFSILIRTFERDTNQVDGSFYLYEDYGLIEKVVTPQAGDIVFYMKPGYSGEIRYSKHSAIFINNNNTSSNQHDDYVISKWSNGPLAEHPVDECPWYVDNVTTFKYYRKVNTPKTLPVPTFLFSPDYIDCVGDKTFQITNIDNDIEAYVYPPYSEISWVFDIPINVEEIYYGNRKADVSIPASTSASVKTLTVSYEFCDDTTSTTKTVYIGKPHTSKLEFYSDPWGETILSTCETVSAEADYPYGSISAYEWTIPNNTDWEINEEYSGGSSDYQFVEIDYWEDPAPSTEVVAVRATNSCGIGDWKLSTWTVNDCGGYYMMITPVPANDIVFLSIVPEDELEPGLEGIKLEHIKKEKFETGEIPEYVIEIHHFNKGLMKKLKSQDKHHGFRAGNVFCYYVYGWKQIYSKIDN